jgi:uncharacterized protein (DUF427 family)
VRGYVGDVAVVDTRRPVLFWEERFPVPMYAFEPDDVRTDLLRPAAGDPPSKPSFTGPRGSVAEWYDVVVGDRVLPNAAWRRDAPEIRDLLVVSWQSGLLDRWLEEDEVVAGHPRDPHKRVDALPSSRHVVISSGGVTLADTREPVLLFETGLPTRYYVPRESVDFDVLTATDNRSHCPYKGEADRYWSVVDQPKAANVAWSYSDPYPAVGHIKDMVAFYNEVVDIEVDGVALEHPTSPFSARANRPGA